MFKQYIGGKLVEGSGRKIEVTNPATGKVAGTCMAASAQQAEEALNAAAEAFKTYKNAPLVVRTGYLAKLRGLIMENQEKILELLISETGKPYSAASMDFFMGVGSLDFFAEEVKHLNGESLPEFYNPRGTGYNIVEYRPAGVVVAHMAWNFPFLNLMVKLAPPVASGCTCVLKPSSNTPLTSLFVGELCEKAEIPAGVVNIVSGPASEIGKTLNSSKIPRLITIIGSSETGRQVMLEGATSIKEYSLELGGNAPCIVMPDADVKETAKRIVALKLTNAGQFCVTINRLFAHNDIHDKLVECVLEEMRKVKLATSHEFEGESVMGPMITRDARDVALEKIKDATDKGAKLLHGGTVPEGKADGNWIIPAVLTGCTDDMRVFNEEQFAPILAITSFDDLDDTLRRAVDTEYGLRSYLYTHDSRIIAKCFEAFESGVVCVNDPPGGSNVPHVGIKGSGVSCGTSAYGLLNYYDLKVLSLRP